MEKATESYWGESVDGQNKKSVNLVASMQSRQVKDVGKLVQKAGQKTEEEKSTTEGKRRQIDPSKASYQ